MLLRAIRGTVAAGRESDFIAVCRQQVADGARSPGLPSFFAGYRRVDGADRFLLAATWESHDDAIRGAGREDNPRVAEVLGDIAVVESVDVFTVMEPAFRGIVDAPGGVIRVTSGRVSMEARAEMLAWLRTPGRDRVLRGQLLLLGWAMGERAIGDGGMEVIAVSAWPSQLVIDAVAEPGRTGKSLFEAVDSFVTDTGVEQFRAIGLELPEDLADVGSRRVIAARFGMRETADAAAGELSALIASAREAQISVAPLGAPGTASDVRSYVLVARVALGDYARAERLIADHDGDVILSQRETVGDPVATITDTYGEGRFGR